MTDSLTSEDLTIASNAIQVQAEMVYSLERQAKEEGFIDDAAEFAVLFVSLSNLARKFREHAAAKVGT